MVIADIPLEGFSSFQALSQVQAVKIIEFQEHPELEFPGRVRQKV